MPHLTIPSKWKAFGECKGVVETGAINNTWRVLIRTSGKRTANKNIKHVV